MNINIAHIGSNEWFNYKSEIIYGLYHCLRRLGHEVSISHNNFDAKKHNIIIGADWLAKDSHTQKLSSAKIEYSIYEVEAYDGETINHRTNFNSAAYRQLIDKAVAVITPYRYNFDSYSNAGYQGKVLYCPWGYYEEMIDPNIVRAEAFFFHGVFFGLTKGLRAQTLSNLSMQGANIALLDTKSPHLIRSYYLSTSKYGLVLTSGVQEHFVNPFRVFHLIANGIPVLSDNQCDGDSYLMHSKCVSSLEIRDALQSDIGIGSGLEALRSTFDLTKNLSLIF